MKVIKFDMDFRNKYNISFKDYIIGNNIPIDLIRYLELCEDIAICGGLFPRFFINEPVANDIDIFLTSWNLKNTASNYRYFKDILNSVEDFGYKLKNKDVDLGAYKRKVLSLCKFGAPTIQIIAFYEGHPCNIISLFDFTICQCAYVPCSNHLFFTDRFFYDIDNRILHWTGSNISPKKSLDRSFKYINLGFKPDNTYSELVKFIESKNNADLQNLDQMGY